MNQLRKKKKKMNINLPKYNQTVYAELLQAMVWNNKCALCAATGTGKSYIAAKFVQEAVIEQDTPIPGKCKDLEYASSPSNNHDLPGAAIQQT